MRHWAWLLLSAVSLSGGPGPTLVWHSKSPGLEWSERPLTTTESGWPARIIAVRIDPTRYTFHLDAAISPGGTEALWTVTTAPDRAVFAVNAGQFAGASPWGWVVHMGHEVRSPANGPLASAVVFGRDHRVRIIDMDELAAVRDSGIAQEAFQSYPTLLRGHRDIPAAIAHDTTGPATIDRTHADTRLALGLLSDGRLLLVLTRFGALGDIGASAPLGPTIPQMSALMLQLGCVRAVSLDGGLSSQVLLRDSTGAVIQWRGWRAVPLGLYATRDSKSGSKSDSTNTSPSSTLQH